jgi:hypothetical protein
MWKWTVEYNGDIITVHNKANRCFLYVNGREVDCQKGLVSGVLIGKTSSGESIKAVVSAGLFTIYCNIYVDDVKIFNN